MEQTPSSPRRADTGRLARMSVIALMLVLATSFGALLGARFQAQPSAGAASWLQSIPEFQVIEETYEAIRANYVLSDDFTDEELMYGAAAGMVDALGDEGHSSFLNPEEAEAFEQSSRGELIGIGIQVDTTGPMPVVIAPIDGSPAFEAGIRSGDVIIAVDGTLSEDVGAEEVVDLIRGDAGTDVTLTIRHADELDPVDLTITRALITVEPVSRAMLPDGVLWLRVSAFDSGATDGVREALSWGASQNMTGVILDLRNNPGGLVFEAIGIGSEFLPSESVLYQEQDRDGSVRDVRTIGSSGGWQQGDLVVLINDGSASASEIVSSSVKANDRGELVGQTTFGTGTVLLPIDLSGDSIALLGTKLWLTADGEEIWKQGVDPDIEVALEPGVSPSLPIEFDADQLTEENVSALQDEQLLRAIAEIAAD